VAFCSPRKGKHNWSFTWGITALLQCVPFPCK
jgi:hypothetical protein